MVLLSLLIGLSSASGQTRADNRAAAIALHRRLDANHDGFVTFEEIIASAISMVSPTGRLPGRPMDNPVARAQFKLADADHDGRISLQEAIEGADRSFIEADTNHDNILSQEERGAYAARTLAALQADIATWKAPPCQPGAACATSAANHARENRAQQHP
jgi:hypothetical protein